MTTIVVDQKMGYVAADRQATSNDCDVACRYPKIRTVEIDGEFHVLASSGNEGPATIYEDWYEFGEWDEPPEPMSHLDDEDAFTTLVLKPNCELWIVDKFMTPYRWHSRIYATGTGASFAWGALQAGVGIARAMKAAIELDPNSGFGFDVVTITDGGKSVEHAEYE